MGDDSAEILAAFVGGIVFEMNAEGRYLRILSGDSQLLARPAEELLGKTVREVLGAAAAPFEEIIARVVSSGETESYEYTLDVPAGRRKFRCEARRRSIADAPPTVLLLVRDITEETELQAKLISAERLAAVGTVAASVAHEIRQPLAFATTSLEVLANELEASAPTAPPSKRATEALEHVRDAIRRISSIAASVSVVATNARSTRTTTAVRPPLDAALVLCASAIRNRTHVCVDVDGALRVRAPESELCQVLSNVILNAAQAMEPAHAVDNEIRIYTERLGDTVAIAVRDTASGIAPEIIGRIFDPFFTTKDDGRGSGLGLYLSRRIVERWGGRIRVASKPGVGTTVTIELPADDAHEPSPAPPKASAARRRPAILVVDDERTFLRSLSMLLEGTYDVTSCSKAGEAVGLVRANPQRFDAVLCDLSMPEVDGVAFYEEMDRLGVARRFVLMTGGAYTPRAAEFVSRVHCARIEKPFTPDELDRVLAAVAPIE